MFGPNAVLDGIVMRLDAFGQLHAASNPNFNQGRILAHEAGHYLGLFHTFQDGCVGTTAATCNNQGDDCCDTPPVANFNQVSCPVFNAPPCPGGPAYMHQNHMDYMYDDVNTCRNTFTDDQVNRMHATIQLYRSNLVSFQNLLVTGLTNPTGCMAGALSPEFISTLPNNSMQLCAGNTIGFTSVAGANSYQWTFPGGTPATSTTANPTGIIFATPGVYNITLQITDINNNTFQATHQLFVTTCTPYTGNRAHWYFGVNCSMNFSTGVGVSQAPSSISAGEASAAISDNTGNLLFYTDGRSVWNRNHVTMANGNFTLNGHPNSFGSAAQSVVIVPRQNNQGRYFIYTQSDAMGEPINYGISQYEVDMNLSSGNGDVISTVPIHPGENYATCEPVVAIPHCNGNDHWLLTKPRNNTQPGLTNNGPVANINNFFAAYLVNNGGIANVPVLSQSAPFVPSANFASNDGVGQIAVSPNKKLICFASTNLSMAYIYYFDCETGRLNFVANIDNITGYGICFSPNSQVLYAKSDFSIRQYDLSDLSNCNGILPYKSFSIQATPSHYFGSLQLGPDNKIYVSFSNLNFVGIINFPNNLNNTSSSNECGYNFQGVNLLSGQFARMDLPNDIIGQAAPLTDDFSFDITGCSEVCFTNLGCGTNFAWNFGDGNTIAGVNSPIPFGTNGGNTTGNFEYPRHTYAGPGTFTVTLSIDGRPVVTRQVVITNPPPAPVITGPLFVCPNLQFPTSYFAPLGFDYVWTGTNTTPANGNNLPTFDVNFILV